MKIAVTSIGKDLISDMDTHFGRAKYFILVDPRTLEYDVIDNKQNLNLSQGAGIQASKAIVDQKADVLICDNCGPKTSEILNAAGIKVVTGVKGRVIDGIIQYKSGQIEAIEASG